MGLALHFHGELKLANGRNGRERDTRRKKESFPQALTHLQALQNEFARASHCQIVIHLFFSCMIAARLWKMCDSWPGIYSIHHNFAEIHFLQFEHLGLSKICNIVWRCIWVATILGIWNKRNNKNAKVDVEEMFSLTQIKTWV